jgi:hypothetical protein
VPVVARHLARVARELTGSTAAALVSVSGERPRVLATAGDDVVRSIALAAAHAGWPVRDELQVIDVDELPALTIEASALLAKAAVVPVDDAVLVVVCDSFGERAQGVLSAVAGQGGLALRSAELLAGRRVAS